MFCWSKSLGALFYNMNITPNRNPTAFCWLQATARLFKAICRAGKAWVVGEKLCWPAWSTKSLEYKVLGLCCGLAMLAVDQQQAGKMLCKELGGWWAPSQLSCVTEAQLALHKGKLLLPGRNALKNPRAECFLLPLHLGHCSVELKCFLPPLWVLPHISSCFSPTPQAGVQPCPASHWLSGNLQPVWTLINPRAAHISAQAPSQVSSPGCRRKELAQLEPAEEGMEQKHELMNFPRCSLPQPFLGTWISVTLSSPRSYSSPIAASGRRLFYSTTRCRLLLSESWQPLWHGQSQSCLKTAAFHPQGALMPFWDGV